MLILNVPYNEKDDAKSLGARWNPTVKKWYVKNKKDYYKFIRWIEPYGNMVIIDDYILLKVLKNVLDVVKIQELLVLESINTYR